MINNEICKEDDILHVCSNKLGGKLGKKFEEDSKQYNHEISDEKNVKNSKIIYEVDSSSNENENKENSLKYNHYQEVEEEVANICKKLFPEEENEPKLIKQAKSVKDCSILKYGIKPSNKEIEYTFCKTCDVNLIYPICIPCINECHKGHNYNKNYCKGHIKCGCGERLHFFGKTEKAEEKNIKCPFIDWSMIGKHKFCYRNGEKKYICIFCHNFCAINKDDEQIENIDDIHHSFQCSCQNEEIHSESKKIFEKMNHIVNNSKFDFGIPLSPIKILNLIFKSTSSFFNLYVDFANSIDSLSFGNILQNYEILRYFTSANFTNTNFYKSIDNFSNIVEANKKSGLRYYCKEVEKYFNFQHIKQIFNFENLNDDNIGDNGQTLNIKNLGTIRLTNNLSLWQFRYKMFHLFRKIYLGNHTQSMDKYKLYDLENFSYLLRYEFFHNNLALFPESSDLIAIILDKLNFTTVNGFIHFEAYDAIIEVLSILRRLSSLGLISNGDMIRICMQVEKCFNSFIFLRKQNIKSRNSDILWSKESKLFYIIIKLCHNFIYTFNDRLIKNIITDKKKYPTINDINFDNAQFIFDKTDLGRMISKLTIKTMSILYKYYAEKENEKIYTLIINHGMKILSFLLYNYDSYLLSLNKSKQFGSFYLELYNSTEKTSQVYNEIIEQQKKLEKGYEKFFNFEIESDDLIEVCIISLEKINSFNHSDKKKNSSYFSKSQMGAILKSNYFFSLCKIYAILNKDDYNKEKYQRLIENIFKFYNNFVNYFSDSALLILSHYIFKNLTMIPNIYAIENFQLFYQAIFSIKIHEKVLSFSKHILKNLYEYLNDLFQQKFQKIYDCLLIFLKIMKSIVLEIKSLDAELIVEKSKDYLVELNSNFNIINKFMKNYNSNSNNNKDIMLIYLELINSIFNSSIPKDRKIVMKMFNFPVIQEIIKSSDIYIRTKTELLRLIRKCFIDLEYSDDNEIYYVNSMINTEDKLANIKNNPLISNFRYPTNLLTFQKNMINISFNTKKKSNIYPSVFDEFSYNIFTNELINIKEYIGKLKFNNEEEKISELRNYFENGILVPSITFLKKSFPFAHLMTGEEVLDLFDFVTLLLQAKIYITEFNIDFWKEEEDESKDKDRNNQNDKEENTNITEHKIKGYNSRNFCINGDFCRNEVLKKQLNEDINKTQAKRFSPYDYTLLYQIAKEQFFSLIKEKEISDTAEDFEQSAEINNIKKLNALERKLYPDYDYKSDIEKRLIRAYTIYKTRKENINESNSCLFTCLPEISLEFETNFRNLIISILIHNGEIFDLNKNYCKESYFLLFKLLSLQTTETQSDIISLLGGPESENLGFLTQFGKILLDKLIQLFIDFFNHHDQIINIDYIYAYNLIKIFKFLCEEHNNFFQGRLIKGLNFKYEKYIPNFFEIRKIKLGEAKIQIPEATIKEINENDNNTLIDKNNNGCNIKFFDFMLHCILKIILITNWKTTTKKNDTCENKYLYDLFAALIELEIEIIQGNRPEYLMKIGANEISENNDTFLESFDNTSSEESNFDFLSNDTFQKFLEETTPLIFADNVNNELIYEVRNQIMQFFIAILEEKNCSEETQKLIIKYLNWNKVIISISKILKNYYIEQQHDLNLKINNVKFNHTLYKFTLDEYFKSTDFSKTNEFLLANIFYRYIKLISVQGKSDEATYIINKVSFMSESEANKKFWAFNDNTNEISGTINQTIEPMNLINENIKSFSEDFIEKFYIIKFFEKITQTVEVRPDGKNSNNQTVIFTVQPEMKYLSEGTKIEFIKYANRDSETTKKNDLLRNIDYFQKEIKYYQKRKGFFTNLFSKIDFTYIQVFVYIYAVIINLFMLFTLSGDTRTNLTVEEITRNELNRKKSVINKKIVEMIDHSIDKWAKFYNILIYIFVAMNGIFILLWILFRMPLYYRLDKMIYMENNKITDKSQLSIFNKMRIALYDTIYERDYITTLIYLFIISLIGAILKRGEIAYPFLLLAIINLNPTLKNIVVGIKMKYYELILTFTLSIIIMFVYANLGFYFFNEDFDDTLDGYEDNYCRNLIFCFLSTVDYGLRNRGGVGDLMARLSFKRNTERYMKRFFYDITFFLLIVIIMTDMVFGIIIESFQELGGEEQKHINDRKNHCFICHVNKTTVEKNREDFNEHREKVHNIWNYVNYMISLKFADLHDLNAINSYAREKLDAKNISWLPSYKEQCQKDKGEEKNDDNDDNFQVEEENVNKHLVKEA